MAIEDSAAPIKDAQGRILGVVMVFHDVTRSGGPKRRCARSERRYRSFVDVTSQFGWVTDAAGKVVEDIPALRSFTGQSYEEAKGEGWAAALHPEDVPRTLEVWNHATSTKTAYEIEYRMRRHDGVYRLLQARGVPILDEQGGVTEWVGTCIDITERKRMEEALRESESRAKIDQAVQAEWQRFYQVLNMMPAYVVLLSPDYHVPFANRFFEERFGKSNGKRCYEYLFNRTEPCENCETFKVLQTKAPHNWEWTGPDGRIYEIHDFPFTDADGSQMIMEMGIDITEMRKAQAALKEANERLEQRVAERTRALGESEERLALALSAARLATWDWKMRTGEVAWNEEHYHMMGYGVGEVEPSFESYVKRVHPGDCQEVERIFRKACTEGGDYTAQFRTLWPDGTIRWIESQSRMELDGAGQPTRCYGVMSDITSRKEAEAQQLLLTDTLAILSRSGDMRTLVGDVLRLIRERTGFDAVGIRLRRGEDCPYYEHDGFSPDFLREENFLCAKRGDGAILHDAEGRAVLECTCGLVLSGKTDPAMSCFTQGGSFWTNVSRELLALPREEDPRTNPRNNCIHRGYQSVGLFPIQGGKEIIGLLQLNDRRERRFSPQSISFYESLAQNIALALQRIAAEEGVRRAEVLMAQAVRVAGLGIFEHDHLSDRIEYSPVMREMLGFGKDEPITIAATIEHVVPEDREKLAARIRHAHDPAGDGLFDVEYRVKHLDRGLRWVSARARTFFEGEGNQRRPVRTIGAVLDVTERKEFQAELERLVAERTGKLQELVYELEHFSYTITHDMRAPLRGMQGFAELMAEACIGCKLQDAQGFLRRIRTSAERMDALITDALSFSKAVRQELPLAPVDLGALLRGMLDSYPEFQPSKAEIAIQGEIPLVMGNEAGLTQCFSNLIGNAVKFVKPGQRPVISIRAEHRDGWVQVWIEDDGIGIPESMLKRVFDMFSRGHDGYEGTGIGLALVQKIVERMGGKVGVESEEGKGSQFWLELKPGEVRVGR